MILFINLYSFKSINTFILRLRKGYVHNESNVALIGPKVDLRYKYTHLGDSPSILQQLVGGDHEVSKKLKSAKKPLVIVGSEILERPDGGAILSAVQALSATTSPQDKEWKVLNVLHKVASQVRSIILLEILVY